MSKVIKLDSWYVAKAGSYDLFNFQLVNDNTVLGGIVVNHPLILDKKHIHTTQIKSFDGTKVETYDETYVLGVIHEFYKEYLKNEGIKYNKQNPLQIAA